MKVLAIVTTYNEADIIGWTVRHLIRQGCEVLVIDCMSGDGTPRIAEQAGAIVTPYQRPPVSWHALLGRIEEICAHQHAKAYDWIVHCDADEIRYSPRWERHSIPIQSAFQRVPWDQQIVPGPILYEPLAAAFQRVQDEGYNAVDHHVVKFVPTVDGYDGSQNPERFFTHYVADPLNQQIGQVKAWRNVGPVSLAASGGHSVQFPGRRVYPEKFLLKHYPIRSQAQGERKVFHERQWLDQAQGRSDWHVQYRGIQPGHSFIRPAPGLFEWGR